MKSHSKTISIFKILDFEQRSHCTKWKFLVYFMKESCNKFNLFRANVPFLYPLKSSQNQSFSDVFKGYRKGALACNWVKEICRLLRMCSHLPKKKSLNFLFKFISCIVSDQDLLLIIFC